MRGRVRVSSIPPQGYPHPSLIELSDINAGGGLIWPQSNGTRGPFIIISMFVIALALLLSIFLPVEEELQMPKSGKSPSKTAETPANKLPFPGKLVEGKYDVQPPSVSLCCPHLLRSSDHFTESKTGRPSLHGAGNSSFPSLVQSLY